MQALSLFHDSVTFMFENNATSTLSFHTSCSSKSTLRRAKNELQIEMNNMMKHNQLKSFLLK